MASWNLPWAFFSVHSFQDDWATFRSIPAGLSCWAMVCTAVM